MIAADARAALESALGSDVRFDADTSRLTSLRVGGPADALATPATRDTLAALLRVCAQHGVRHRVLGRGFNTLVRDEGVDGLVLRLSKLRAIEREADDRLCVEAGASHASVTRLCRDEGLAGLEFAAGIPGSIGGWIAMNAGSADREMVDVVEAVLVIDASGKGFAWQPNERMAFRYRGADGLSAGAVVVAARFALRASDPAAVGAEVERLLAQRAATQPLDVPSCGSVFRNPPGGHAGALIERAGLKGHGIGGARISPVHANFIENIGRASAADVLALIDLARDTVREQTGIALETEVQIWGRSTS